MFKTINAPLRELKLDRFLKMMSEKNNVKTKMFKNCWLCWYLSSFSFSPTCHKIIRCTNFDRSELINEVKILGVTSCSLNIVEMITNNGEKSSEHVIAIKHPTFVEESQSYQCFWYITYPEKIFKHLGIHSSAVYNLRYFEFCRLVSYFIRLKASGLQVQVEPHNRYRYEQFVLNIWEIPR